MKKKYYLVLAISVCTIFIISGCIQKECEIATECANKTCFAVECKDNNCIYSAISDCCGNEICEVGEIYPECAVDCPNCDDKNNCTVDEYDYHERKCLNAPILYVACCGNGICDKDAETYANCTRDCPNCDDNNRLTADSFNYTTQKCENVLTHYFIDDFEAGLTNWMLTDDAGKPIDWNTSIENANTVLRTGADLYWVTLNKEWTDCIFKVRFKVVNGRMHFNYRLKGASRYVVSVSENITSLIKYIINATPVELSGGKSVQLAKNWHTLEIRGYGNILNVYIDNELLFKNKDTENPILSGKIAFENTRGSEFLIDDVEIKVISTEDIIYP